MRLTKVMCILRTLQQNLARCHDQPSSVLLPVYPLHQPYTNEPWKKTIKAHDVQQQVQWPFQENLK